MGGRGSSSGKVSGAFKPMKTSGLPTLEGSAKQVAGTWAEEIREQKISLFNRYLAESKLDATGKPDTATSTARTLLSDIFLRPFSGMSYDEFSRAIPIGTGLSRAERAAKKAELGDKYGEWARKLEQQRKKQAYSDLVQRVKNAMSTQKSASWWIDHR